MSRLKNKKLIAFDMIGEHPVQYKYDKEGELFELDDIKFAVEWLKEQIRLLPNRDDEIMSSIKKLDGGGVGKFKVNDLIDKAFEDVKNG